MLTLANLYVHKVYVAVDVDQPFWPRLAVYEDWELPLMLIAKPSTGVFVRGVSICEGMS